MARRFQSIHLALLAITLASAACTGTISDSGSASGPGAGKGVPPPSSSAEIAKTGLRRLTAAEYDATVVDLLGDEEVNAALLLPEDVRTPFDNAYDAQLASKALIEGAEILARDIAGRLVADASRRQQVVGCTPDGPGDAECFRAFVQSFGRRALRRPLSDTAVSDFMSLQSFGIEKQDFWVGIETALRAFLQHPAFLYRIEIGEPVAETPGLYKLNSWETATRLSYLLWGSTPSDALLDRAQQDRLRTAADRAEVAREMLAEPRARKRMVRFFSMWLGFETLPHEASLSQAMQQETGRLIERVVFEDSLPFQDLFRFEETYADAELAQHYGLVPPASSGPSWVSYAGSGRQGILGHGSFLSNGADGEDTSPTLRGLAIRTRLMCETIPEPPSNVVTDIPTASESGGACKTDLYKQHAVAGCANCHNQMDPIGFGLENYDQLGRFRSVEAEHPECVIEGKGELVELGPFSGPRELSELLLESRKLEPCVTRQLYRFAYGKNALGETDQFAVDALVEEMGSGDFRFDELVLALVSSDAFAYRREE